MTRGRPSASALGLVAWGLIVLAFFGDVLFAPGGRVLSAAGTDVWRQFAGWRAFGFGVWKDGDFPLWNPLVYGGMPYFTGFQSALLYPPNALFLVAPLLEALNWTMALHLGWLGAGAFLWLRRARLHPAAAGFGSVLAVFGGAHFLHLYAGHLTNLCVMAWAPWLFLAIESWRVEGRARWALAGAGVVAMEVFAGHPQYVYYSAIAAGLFAIGLGFRAARASRVTFALGVLAMFVLGALLSAVQWLPAAASLDESVRSGGTGALFAGSYSFPPENLLTTFLPRLFGDGVHGEYWGRWFYWESCAYVGVAGLTLIVLGAWRAADRGAARVDAVLAMAVLVLALGMYTPLFPVALRVVPGWSLFRGTSKLAFLAALFAARLAARGADAVLQPSFERPARAWGFAAGALIVGAVVAGAALAAPGTAPSWWTSWREALWSTGQVTHLTQARFFAPDFAERAARGAGRDLLAAAAKATAAAACVFVAGSKRWGAWALLALGCVELLIFAAPLRRTFPLADLALPEASAYRRAHDGDFRVLDGARTNGGLLSGLPDIWGDDPGVLRRYAELMAATQGLPPGEAGQALPIHRVHPRWDLLRFRAALVPRADGGADVHEIDVRPLGRFEIVPSWEVRTDRDAVLARVLDPGFDPRRTVVLEQSPEVRPVASPAAPSASAGESCEVLRESVDEVVVRVTAPAGGVLLMTDPYSRGWTAGAAGPSAPQARYDLQPADWALRGIPLVPGTHEIRMAYRPRWLGESAAVSLSAWVALAGVGGVTFARRRRAAARVSE
ncbi:MAG: hypothetical protein U0167_14855 [bacterium]